jgi:hypothetical protein
MGADHPKFDPLNPSGFKPGDKIPLLQLRPYTRL